METVHVIACVIERDGCYLICRRPPDKRHGGMWEFPGGKLEAGESMFDAAQRELAEELSMQVHSVAAPLLAVHDSGSPYVISFTPVQASGDPQLREHTDCRWLSPAQLAELPLAPSDRRFVDYLRTKP